jgi:hypothetical protein
MIDNSATYRGTSYCFGSECTGTGHSKPPVVRHSLDPAGLPQGSRWLEIKTHIRAISGIQF